MSEPAVDAWTPFLFGKLPAHGDFVCRGLAPAAQAAWDEWAQASLRSSREALNEAFEEAHDFAPSILFICAPTPRAEGWCCGAIAASIDSVGRRFVVVVGLQGLSSSEALLLGAGIAELAESAIRAALVERLTADATVALMQDLSPQKHRAAAASLGLDTATFGLWWRTDGGDIDKRMDAPPHLVTRPLVPPNGLENAPA